MSQDIIKMLAETKAVAKGHFVYKALHNHGPGYIDKDMFPAIGALNLVALLQNVAEKALEAGLYQILHGLKQVALLLPAYGAIKYGLPLAASIEEGTGVKVIVFETEVEKDPKTGRRIHLLPENQKKRMQDLIIFGAEDIVNSGTTIRELHALLLKELGVSLFAALAIVDRGGQSKETLGINGYFPFMRMNMEQYDVRNGPCPLCTAGVPINTDLGKGAGWVKMFGQPPYPEGMDFSAFWAENK